MKPQFFYPQTIFSGIFILILSLLVSGCRTTALVYSESNARNIEPKQGVIAIPLVANIELIQQEKITPYFEDLPYYVTLATIENLPGYKAAVMANAVKQYGADLLVGALIEVTTLKNGKLRITVTGWPTKFTNFRPASQEDSWLLPVYNILNDTNKSNEILLK